MRHEEIHDLLEGYVDETLDRATRREVGSHLATCEECRALLDGVAPVDLGEMGSAVWSAGDMRRAVRRSMLRVAADALLLLFVGWLAAWALSFLVVQPFVVNRGGRAGAATVATVDLAIMHNPGSTVTEYLYRSGFLGRVTDVDVALPVGSAVEALGTVSSHLGILGFGDAEGGRLFPRLSEGFDIVGGEERLRSVGDGTVATVELRFDTPLELQSAEEMNDSTADVRIVWGGFEVAEVGTTEFAYDGVLGYSACASEPTFVREGAPGTSGGGSGTMLGAASSLTSAAAETRRALANLVDHPDLLEGIGATEGVAVEAVERLETPRVTSVVVTGPTTEILRFLDETAPDTVAVVAIDFMNWAEPPCGESR